MASHECMGMGMGMIDNLA